MRLAIKMLYPFTDTVTFIFRKRSINGALVTRQHGIDIKSAET